MVDPLNEEGRETNLKGDHETNRKFFNLICGILVTVVILLSLEFFAFVALKIKGHTPFFLVRTDLKQNFQWKESELSSIDPHLGFAHNLEAVKNRRLHEQHLRLIPGFIQYYNPNKKPSETIKIVTLGGSTTDGILVDWSWPEYLFKVLDEDNFNVTVYNGAVAGYYSAQEMFKLVRDVLPLHPNLIIAYSGINDLGYLGSHWDHYYVHPYQRRLFRYLATGGELTSPLFPSTLAVGHKIFKKLCRTKVDINYGTPSKDSPSKHWFINMNIMHSVSKSFNTKFLCILQPTLGIGNYDPTAEELDYLRFYEKKKPGYLEKAKSFYIDTKIKCNESEFCIDLTDVFAGQSAYYIDATHQNKAGRYFLAQAIRTELLKRELLAQIAPLAALSVQGSTARLLGK